MPAAGIEATVTVNSVAAGPVKVRTSSSSFHDAEAGVPGLVTSDPEKPGMYMRQAVAGVAAAVVTVMIDAAPGVATLAVRSICEKTPMDDAPLTSSAEFAAEEEDPTEKKYSSVASSVDEAYVNVTGVFAAIAAIPVVNEIVTTSSLPEAARHVSAVNVVVSIDAPSVTVPVSVAAVPAVRIPAVQKLSSSAAPA